MNKYQCRRCKGTGEEPETEQGPISLVANLQAFLDDHSLPRDEHDAIAAAIYEIERMRALIEEETKP